MDSDSEQLLLYAASRSEAAFASLVQRHLGMVYSTALRRVAGDTMLAQDVSQEVFRDLSLKAKTLSDHPCLASWIYKATCFAAAKAVRKEQRQRTHIEAAMILDGDRQKDDLSLNPFLVEKLDDAMNALPESEQHTLLLRFFESRSLRDVGQELGISEEAARKRVQRAVDKLRGFFKAQGIDATASATTAFLMGFGAVTVPESLGAAICGGVAAVQTKIITGIGFMGKLKASLLTVCVLGSTTIALLEYRTILNLKREIRDRDRLLAEQAAAAPATAIQRELPAAPKVANGSNSQEILKLRDLVTRQRQSLEGLQAQLGNAEAVEAFRKRLGGTELQIERNIGSTFAPGHYYPRKLWADVGLASPEATLQTALWAASSGQVARLFDAMNLPRDKRERVLSSWSPETLRNLPGANAAGVKIEAFGGTLDSERIEYVVVIDEGEEQHWKRAHFYLDKVDGKWRLAPNISMEGGNNDYLVPL